MLQKIDQEISHPRVIVCLQEVSYDWAGSLHTFFANRGYHFVTGLYGRPFNGYMGVAMAWPTSAFETIDVDISRLSDTRKGGWPREDPDSEDIDTKPCFSLFSWLFPKKKSDEETLDPWEYSERRFNVLLTATLKDKDSKKQFCIGNYHMPCAFYAPQVMTIHSEMAAHRVQQLANQHCTSKEDDNKLPYIVAGDWNVKPLDSAYKLLTTGALEADDPAYPEPAMSKLKPEQTLMTWEPRIEPMRSAYASAHEGQEPDFTNYAAPRSTLEDDECFIDTLDYIFLSREWKVLETIEIPNRSEVKGPFPNLDTGVREPSDHILIYAKLELTDSALSGTSK